MKSADPDATPIDATVDDGAAIDAAVAEPSTAQETGDHQLGTYIRELRMKRNMSLRSLAAKSEVSVSFLSQVERGTASPSIASLMRIAKSLDQTISSLFEQRGNSRLVRAGEGPRLVHPQREWEEELLSPRDFSRLQVIRSSLAPGGSSGPELLSYGGASETSMVVETGAVSTTLGTEQFDLLPGDCLSFDASTPHRIVNSGTVPAVILFVSSPPSY